MKTIEYLYGEDGRRLGVVGRNGNAGLQVDRLSIEQSAERHETRVDDTEFDEMARVLRMLVVRPGDWSPRLQICTDFSGKILAHCLRRNKQGTGKVCMQ